MHSNRPTILMHSNVKWYPFGWVFCLLFDQCVLTQGDNFFFLMLIHLCSSRGRDEKQGGEI
jgi:hypothetical protein